MDVTASAPETHRGLSLPRFLQVLLVLNVVCAQPALAQHHEGGTTREGNDGGSSMGNLEELVKTPQPAPKPRPITFSVIGDAPYGDAEIPTFQEVMFEHTQYSKARFVLHVGDTWGGSDDCTEQRFINTVGYLEVLDVPVFIVPGDNEWVDCPDADQAWVYWSTYLMGLEQHFCGTPPVERQSVRPENIAFIQEGVLFIGVNIVSGAPDPTMIDSAAWVEQMFQKYQKLVRAAVVFSQAGPSSSRDLFFQPFWASVQAFAKPVLHIHGDGHSWQYEYPSQVPNLTRVQIERTTTPPVHVTVTLDSQQPFVFDRDPWPAGTPLANNVPCVDAGPSQVVSVLGTANLKGSGRDDGIPGPLSFQWRQMSGPGVASIADATSPTTTATFSDIGTYVMRLEGNDGFYSHVDTMTVIAADSSTVPMAVNDIYAATEDVLLQVPAPGVLSNDSHGGGLSLSASLETPPTAGSVTLAANGGFTYQPDPDFFGTDTFYYTVTDPLGGTAMAMVTLQVSNVNDAPVAAGESFTTTVGEDLVQAAPGVLANDTDVDGDVLTVSLERNVSEGTLLLWPDGSFTYSPRIDFIGTDSFDYRVSDGISDSLATATIDVTPVLLTLGPVGDSYVRSTSATSNYGTSSRLNVELDTTVQHTYLKFDVTGIGGAVQRARLRLYANDGGPDGGTVYPVSNDYEATTTPWLETGINWNNAPVIGGTPLASFGNISNNTWAEWDVTDAITGDGTYSFGIQNASTNVVQYSSKEGSNPPELLIETDLPNDPPVAADDAYSVDEDNVLVVTAPGVLSNDTDDPRDILSTMLLTGPASGALVFGTDGSFTYTPEAEWSGTVGFTYRVQDTRGGADSANVSITVNAVNDAPVALADSFTVSEDSTLTVAAPGVLGNDTDVEGQALTASLVTDAAHGALALASDGSFVYTPVADFFGLDAFVYAADDGAGGSDSTTVTLWVTPVADAPVAYADSFTVPEDSTLVVAAPGVLANDVDGDGDSLSVALITDVTQGSLTLDADGGLTYTPPLNFHGVDTFAYAVSDTSGASDSTMVTLLVTPVNDAPVVAGESYTIAEDSTLVVAAPGLLANDTDVDGDSLIAVIFNAPASGTAVVAADGSFTYTPDANFNGSDSFQYVVSDGQGGNTLGTVSLTLTPVNDVPVAVADSFSVAEDSTVVVAPPGVLGNDVEVDGDSLFVALDTDVTHGTLVLAANGGFTYTPVPNFNGSDSFTYVVGDSVSLGTTAVVTLQVPPRNDAPIAVADSFSTDEDVPLVVAAPGVLANDSDIDGDSLQATVASGPAQGSLSLAADGSFTYTPAPDFHGADGFTYILGDGQGGSDSTTVSITVLPVNDAPLALADSFSVLEDSMLTVVAPGVLANDSDVDGDPLSVTLAAPAAHGVVALQLDGAFYYTPAADFFGADSFAVNVSDGQGGVTPSTVYLNVSPSPDAPVAATDSFTTDEDVPLVVPAPGVLANDSDADGDSLAVAVVTAPANGLLLLEADGSFTYTPAANYHGADGFTYLVDDGTGRSDTTSVALTVQPVNDLPVALNDSYGTLEDIPLQVTTPGVLGNDGDPDADVLTVSVVTGPANGALELNGDGSFTYTPAQDFNGADGFTYAVNDGAGGADSALVDISVTAVNDSAVAVADSFAVDEDASLLEPAPGVLANDVDVDGDSITALLVAPPVHGTLVLAADGGFLYTPEADFFGEDGFTYEAQDGQGAGTTVDVVLTVNSVNDAPVALADSFGTAEDTPLVVAAPGVLGNDSDPEGDPLTATVDTQPTQGTLNLASDGSLTYTPSANFYGSDGFTYIVSDGNGGSDTTSVALTVTSVPDAPVATADSFRTNEDTPLVVAAPGVLGNDTDADGDSLTAAVDTQPTYGTLDLAGDGSFTYTPAADFNGSDGFTYIVSDGNGGSDTTIVVLTVLPVNDPPVALADSFTTSEDTPLGVVAPGLLGNDNDQDGDALTAAVDTQPTHGTLDLSGDGSFTYTPTANFAGNDGFTYLVSDGNGGSDTTSVVLTVNPVNDAPVAMADSFTTAEDTPLVVAAPGLLGNDTDAEGDSLTASVETSPSNGSLSLAADGSFTYTPAADFFGTDTFTYTAADDSTASIPVTVTLMVTPVPDAPVALADSFATPEDTPLVVAAPGVLANDADVDGDSLVASVETSPSSGTLDLSGDGSFTYTPAANFAGSDGFTYFVSDGNGGSDTTSVALTVLPVNDAPVALADSFSTAEDTPLVVGAPGLLGNDSDLDGDALTASVDTEPSNGSLALAGDGSFTYTPAANFYGSDGFTYIVSDGNGGSDTASVAITVTSVPDAPVASADSCSTNEDTPLVVAAPGVLGNDTDADGDSLTAAVDTQPTHGTLGLAGDGGFTYTPAANFAGTDGFTYLASDGNGGSDTTSVVLTVIPVNDTPVALADSFATAEDTALVVGAPGLLGNDSDLDGDALTAAVNTQPVHGTLDLAGDGSFTYTPAANFYGSDGFTYLVSDGNGGSDTTSVALTVNPVNDAPIALTDSFTIAEDTPLVVAAPGLLGNDSDVEGDSLTANVETSPSNGNLSLAADGSFTYTPAPNFFGTDTFTYTAADDSAASIPVTVTLTVTPTPDSPVALADSFATSEDTPLIVAAPGVLANDVDVDGDSLAASVETLPSNGTFGLAGDGGFTYTPAANFYGNDGFTYIVSDGNGGSDTTSVALTVLPVNDAPVALADSFSTSEDTPLVIAAPGVLGNDSDLDGDGLTASVDTEPSNGNLTLSGDGSFTYMPAANFAGSDGFTYIVSDGNGGSDTTSVALTVTPLPDAPVAVADSFSTAEDTPLVIAAPGVLANDTDAEGDSLTASVGSTPSNGSLSLAVDGSFTYTPAPNFNGNDSFTYLVSDGNGGSDTGTVMLTVTPVNDAPVALADSFSTAEDTPLVLTAPGVLSNDSDPDGDVLTASVDTEPVNGTLSLAADGSLTYTPAVNFAGSDAFSYIVDDGAGASDTTSVALTVTPVNDAPVAVTDSFSVDEDATLTVVAPGVLGNDTDAEGNALATSVDGNPTNGNLTLNADGSFEYTPASNYHGTDAFSYIVDDGNGGSDTTSVVLTVLSINDVPVALADSFTTFVDSTLVVSAPGLLANDIDLDGDSLTVGLSSGPSHGGLTLNADGSFTYTPTATFEGTDSFTYTASDNSTASAPVTATIQVMAPAAAVAMKDGKRGNKNRLDDPEELDEGTPADDESAAVKPSANSDSGIPDDSPSEGILLDLGPSGLRAYPNPFNARITLEYRIDQDASVTAEIYDARGHRVRGLYQGQKAPGRHHLVWDGRNEAGLDVHSGVYFLRFRIGERTTTTRLILIK